MAAQDEIFAGRTEQATYQTPAVPSHRGNPLIEALPPILEEKRDIVASLLHDVTFEPDLLAASARVRLHEIDLLRQLWVPDKEHIALEGRISTMLRSGYRNRNPADVESWYATMERARENLAAAEDGDGRRRAKGMPSVREVVQAHATGLSVVGLSGVGKTTSVKRVLSRYPQVILHGADRNDLPVSAQLVWLMITCPGDGGVVGLARAILRAFDAVLGTSYHDDFTNKRASAETMRGAAVSLAHLHALGVLVIDEIQILNRSNSDNVEGITNFLLALMNDLRVPVVVIGTVGASKFLSGEMQTGRRLSSAGHYEMHPLHEGRELEAFVRRIWSRSLLRETPDWADLSPQVRDAILRAIWFMTAGVQDLVVKSFLLAQYRALEQGDEALTPEIFEQVYKRDFRPLHEFIVHMRGDGLVDDLEWDAIRKSFYPEDGGTEAPAPVVLPPASPKPRKGSQGAEPPPAKRIKKRKASPPHRAPRKEDPAETAARLEQLRKDGVLGSPVTGTDGDFDPAE
ncbi:MAG: hypothetical protein DI532_20635 [Azospirillum brasilense]|nr:MAG: hypothetical protein DI532_20635 [Azospirillum brasilense]